MNLSKLLIVNIILLNAIFAAGETNYDIVPRLANFIIFAGLLYYLVGSKLKGFLSDRSNAIAAHLTAVEDKIRQSKQALNQAKKESQDAQGLAIQIKTENEKQIAMFLERKERDKQDQLRVLSLNAQEHKSIMYRKMLQTVTQETLKEVFKDALSADDKVFVQSMLKKVIK